MKQGETAGRLTVFQPTIDTKRPWERPSFGKPIKNQHSSARREKGILEKRESYNVSGKEITGWRQNPYEKKARQRQEEKKAATGNIHTTLEKRQNMG